MSDIIGGIGSAVEGGLFARAIEPGSGAKEPHPDQPEECLNCGTPLTGAFCHACGQKGHLHRTIGAFMHELVHGALHFEGKFWRTLPMLAFRPGKLTRRYIDGERARFVSPMALFLFAIFMMFAIFQLAGVSAPTEFDADAQEVARDLAIDEVTRLRAERSNLQSQLAEPDLGADERAALEADLSELETNLGALESASAELPFLEGFLDGLEDGAEAEPREEVVGGIPIQTDAEGNTSIPLSADGTASMSIDSDTVGFGEAIIEKWRSNPGLMLYKLQTNFYKFSWLLIPISIPFVWLLFMWKRRFKAYDHAIFITYSLSFMTILILISVIAGLGGLHPAIIALTMIFVPPIHMYKHLRGTYQLGRLSTLWRLFMLQFFILIILMLFGQLLFLLGAF